MDNVVVKFISDRSGLQPGIDGLEQIKLIDAEVAEQAKKTVEVIRQRDKGISDGAKVAKKDIEGLATAVQNADKAILGGAFKKSFEDIRSQVGLTNKEAKAFYENIKTNSQAEILNGGKAEQELKELESLIQAASHSITELGQESQNTEKKAQSFRARLRELKDEMNLLEAAGQEDSAAFAKLAIEAGKVEDQIGDTSARIRAMASDTFAFDAVLSGVQGITAGFQAGQGAMELFGIENEDTQRALVKLNAIMAITQGLQQVRQTLEKQSAIMIAVTNAQQRINIAQTALQGAAESKNIIIRYAAITAQKLLNAAMAANPAGLLLAAIAAVAGVLVYFSSKSNDAADAQKKLTTEIKDQNEALERMKGIYDELNNDLDRTTQLAIARAKARGASEQDLLGIEQEGLRQRIANMKSEQGQLINSKQYTEETSKRYKELTEDISAAETKLRVDSLNNQAKMHKDLSDEQKEAYEKDKANREKHSKEIQEIARRNADALFQIEQRKLQREAESLKEGVDGSPILYKLRLQALEEHTLKQGELLKLQRDHDLNNSKLTAAERLNIEDKYFDDVLKLQEDAKNKKVTIENSYTEFLRANRQAQAEEEKRQFEDLPKSQKEGNDFLFNVMIEEADRRLALADNNRDEDEAREREHQRRKAEIMQAGFAFAQELSNTFFQNEANARQNALDEQLRALSDQREKELGVKNITEQQKENIDKKFRAKENQVRYQAAVDDKNLKIAQARVNEFLAISLAIATTPWPASLLTAGFAAASAEAAIGQIRGTPIPRFKKGKVRIDGPGTETSDSIPAYLSKNESVIKADMTKKWEPALLAINENRFEKYLANLQRPTSIKDTIAMPALPESWKTTTTAPKGIDYEKLGRAVAKHLPAPVQNNLSIDKNGLEHYVVEGGNKLKIRNQRYKTKQ